MVILIAVLVLLGVLVALALLSRRRPYVELTLLPDQQEVTPGTAVTGVLRLQALRPVQAGHLSLALVAEAEVTEFDHGTRQHEQVERYREDLILADPANYPEGFEGQFSFDLLLPRLQAVSAESQVAPLQGHQCERVHWYLIARLPVQGREQIRRLALVQPASAPLEPGTQEQAEARVD